MPIPQAELDRMRSTLSPTYGAQVWEGAGARILVVRVPRGEPDLVTDIEAAVDYLSPGDTQDLTAALLVGDAKAHAVPTQPFKDLMERRVNFDAEQARELRRRLAPGAHLTYRAPGDARKTIRLGLRLRNATVAQLGDEDLAQWGETLGPDLLSGRLSGVRAVYLVADQDDVRLDAELFLQDLRHRLLEAVERKTMAQKLAAKQSAAPAQPGAKSTSGGRVAYAPLRNIAGDSDEQQGEGPHGQGPHGQSGANAATPSATSPTVLAVQQALEAAGFDVMLSPPVKHAIDVAGERADGDVQRVIVRTPERFTLAIAQEILATCRAVDTDLALVVCADADADARKRIIATKVRWVRPADLGNLRL